jgi:YVTN family beta-propeller protein
LAIVAVFAVAFSVHGGSSNSLLDVAPDGSRLLVANPDNGTVTVVDTKARAKLREVSIGEQPEGVAWIGSGPLAIATCYREDRVVIFDTGSGDIVAKIDVADEPYGVVTDKAGRRAWITHDYLGSVSEIDLESKRVTRSIAVDKFIRGIAVTPDESRLYVSGFLNGVLYAIELASGKVVDRMVGHTTDNLARHVLLHPSRPKAYLTHIRSKVQNGNSRGAIFPQLTVCTLTNPPAEKSDGADKRRVSIPLDTYNGVYVVTNAWESAITPDGSRIFTIYAGTDDMNVSRVIDDDYQEMVGIGLPVQVGRNPKAVRVSPDGKSVYVYNAMDFSVSVYSVDGRQAEAKIAVCAPPKSPEWVRGKTLFESAKPPMTSPRWVSCSSCHPAGQPDGRTWHNPEGLRRTTGFFGMAHTHPIHWSADRDEVQDFEYTIRSRLMTGRGLVDGSIKPKVGFNTAELDEKLSGRSKDLDALATYSNSFSFTLSPHIPAPGKLSEVAERGKAIFFSKETNCASCHSGPYYTDSTIKKPFNLHDVGTGADDPTEKIGPKYDTPTLLGAYRQASYLHHGKAKTLHDVLTTFNRGDKHGKTSHLNAGQIDDLVAFLKSLPYETPPDETPNTVSYRFKKSK